jgi:hypothetical protein
MFFKNMFVSASLEFAPTSCTISFYSNWFYISTILFWIPRCPTRCRRTFPILAPPTQPAAQHRGGRREKRHGGKPHENLDTADGAQGLHVALGKWSIYVTYSYGKLPMYGDLPIENGDFPQPW